MLLLWHHSENTFIFKTVLSTWREPVFILVHNIIMYYVNIIYATMYNYIMSHVTIICIIGYDYMMNWAHVDRQFVTEYIQKLNFL